MALYFRLQMVCEVTVTLKPVCLFEWGCYGEKAYIAGVYSHVN